MEMSSLGAGKSSVSQALDDVNQAAQDDISGSGQAHVKLREAIRRLTLAVETPGETLMRNRFQVYNLSHPPLPRAGIHLPGQNS